MEKNLKTHETSRNDLPYDPAISLPETWPGKSKAPMVGEGGLGGSARAKHTW